VAAAPGYVRLFPTFEKKFLILSAKKIWEMIGPY